MALDAYSLRPPEQATGKISSAMATNYPLQAQSRVTTK
jgi:hypothetical protein